MGDSDVQHILADVDGSSEQRGGIAMRRANSAQADGMATGCWRPPGGASNR